MFFLLISCAVPANATTLHFGAAEKQLSSATDEVADGYYSTTTLHAVDPDLAAGNIASGTTIFGVGGTAAIAVGDAALTDVLSGKTFSKTGAYGLTGTMPIQTLSAANDTVAAGYYGATTLNAVDPDLAPAHIKKSVNIFGVTGTYEPAGSVINYGLPKTGNQPGFPVGAPTYAGDDCWYASPETHDVGYPRGKLTWAGYNTARFTDNGDHTVTDNATGLMWEQKTAGGSGGLHDANNTYTWANAFDVFIAGLNTEGGTGFAGHNDWRLPNRFDLESILDLGRYNLAINPIFVNTSTNYWSSTTVANTVANAWYVSFGYGDVPNDLVKTYAIRARAVRGGAEVVIMTPTLTTIAVTNITSMTASSGGNISSDGGAPVTARGVCWNTGGSPTTADSKTTDGTGTGIFTSSIEGLTAGTIYYVRAYASNIAGTTYGDQVSFEAAVAQLGDTYAGGIVFYVDGTGLHGLVAAPSDQSTGIQWYNGSYVVTGASGTTVGTGQSNTTAIVNVQGAGSYAAKLCDNLVLNGYDDWFMPSKDELGLMYTNLKVNGLGGFNGTDYMSSSEDGSDYVWTQYFPNGIPYENDKHYANYVRAARAF